MICLPYQAGVSGPETQVPGFMMQEETAASIGPHFMGAAPAAPLVMAQKGYDMGYLGYGMAAPDPFGGGPICETYIDDCTYSTEETRTFKNEVRALLDGRVDTFRFHERSIKDVERWLYAEGLEDDYEHRVLGLSGALLSSVLFSGGQICVRMAPRGQGRE